MPCDYSIYPPNWFNEIRPRILKRANNCCEFCKVPNSVYVFRGKLDGQEVYQRSDGNIYAYPSGKYITTDVFAPVAPINDDPLRTAIKIVLTIMHLDHDPENWQVKDERLKAGCQKCHLAYDAPEKARKRRVKKYEGSLFPI